MRDDAEEDAVRWLSYSQIAALRGISRTSAERMVRRAKWRRQVDNQGVTKAAVPLAYAEPERTNLPDRQGENPPDHSAFKAALAAIREAKDSEIVAKDALIAAKDSEAAGLRERADRAETRADRAEAALTAERSRVDELMADLTAAEAATERARHEAQEALQRAEGLREAETTRRARGRWARLRAAWRGD
jgi:chromosome segregation ATPase